MRERMWADVPAGEWVCREVYVHRCAGAMRGCRAYSTHVLVRPGSSSKSHVASVLLSLPLWEKLSHKSLHEWCLRVQGEVGDVHPHETAPLEVFNKVVSLLGEKLHTANKPQPWFLAK